METRLHLKGLNGIRAIAAFAVILAHLRIALPDFPAFSSHPFDIANYGVTIFFTLSGFLITYLLFIEKKKEGINIRHFYIRRALRIWPLYFTYLIIAVLTIYIYDPGKLAGSLPFYVFFAANLPGFFGSAHLPFLEHYWSLGVEEQFYIFWPWLIKRSAQTLRALIIFTIIFLLLKAMLLLNLFHMGTSPFLRFLEINRFECMSIGGIAALLCIEKNTLFLKITTSILAQLICLVSLLLMGLNKFHLPYIPDNDLVALISTILIVNVSFNEQAILKTENAVFNFLGRISYGMYIIHPLVIFYYCSFLNRFTLSPTWKLILVYLGVIALTIFFAWVSYNFLEKWFLRLKEKFSTIKNTD